MAWTISYTQSALRQLKKLDRPVARRLFDFMDTRVAGGADPRATGRALTGPVLGTFWRYRVGDDRIIRDLRDETLVVLVLELGNRKDVCR